MTAYPVLEAEPERLSALRSLDILDSAPESDFDAIVRLVAAICETPVALVSLVDADRQWFKARIGFESCETARDVSFCAHAIAKPSDLLVVEDAKLDVRFARNALVTGEPFVRFYAGMPLVTSGGHAIGTICVLDTTPRVLSIEQREALRLVSRVVVILMERRQTIDELTALRRSHESANEQLLFLANHDGLTALPNRRFFLDLLSDELRSGSDIAVAFVDLDRFKEINDTLGHETGDEVLIQVATRIREAIGPRDVVARLGGDEFTICFRDVGGEHGARTAALTVAEELAHPFELGKGGPRRVVASIGVACAQPESTVASLLHEADTAMYVAKSRGLGSMQIFSHHSVEVSGEKR